MQYQEPKEKHMGCMSKVGLFYLCDSLHDNRFKSYVDLDNRFKSYVDLDSRYKSYHDLLYGAILLTRFIDQECHRKQLFFDKSIF